MVVVRVKDQLTVITAGNHMIKPAFDFNPRFSWHAGNILRKISNESQEELQYYMSDPDFCF